VINPTTFLYEHDAATSVATITLNRPDRLNALTFAVYDDCAAPSRPERRTGVRVIITAPARRSSGGDVRDAIGIVA
jgi:enoyl-CoA hydratase/carnithine racemase